MAVYELNKGEHMGFKWCLIPQVAEIDLQTETVGVAIPYEVVEAMLYHIIISEKKKREER